MKAGCKGALEGVRSDEVRQKARIDLAEGRENIGGMEDKTGT